MEEEEEGPVFRRVKESLGERRKRDSDHVAEGSACV